MREGLYATKLRVNRLISSTYLPQYTTPEGVKSMRLMQIKFLYLSFSSVYELDINLLSVKASLNISNAYFGLVCRQKEYIS